MLFVSVFMGGLETLNLYICDTVIQRIIISTVDEVSYFTGRFFFQLDKKQLRKVFFSHWLV